jgi:hypothetical protein
MSKRNKYILSGVELDYLNKWLLRYGKIAIRKHKNMPVLILNTYEDHINSIGKRFIDNTTDMRLKAIDNYIDYVVNIEPTYKRLLKLHDLKGWHIGKMLGYKTALTWHKSYKRYTYIRFLVTMISKHEEILTNLSGK